MDLNAYHNAWMQGHKESECVRIAEDAWEEAQFAKIEEEKYYKEMEEEHYYKEMEEEHYKELSHQNELDIRDQRINELERELAIKTRQMEEAKKYIYEFMQRPYLGDIRKVKQFLKEDSNEQ